MNDLSGCIDYKKLDEFYCCHRDTCKNYTSYNIKIRSNGIGPRVLVKCKDCSMEQDVSDMTNW
jgi:hypothetical protein